MKETGGNPRLLLPPPAPPAPPAHRLLIASLSKDHGNGNDKKAIG